MQKKIIFSANYLVLHEAFSKREVMLPDKEFFSQNPIFYDPNIFFEFFFFSVLENIEVPKDFEPALLGS